MPTGTLTIFIDSIVTNTEGEKIAIISSAMLSTADQLVGTGAEINGKLYMTIGEDELLGYGDARAQWLSGVEIGANYIEARIGFWDDWGQFHMGWYMRETTTDELVILSGTFTAQDGN